jgi:hypothetical protein
MATRPFPIGSAVTLSSSTAAPRRGAHRPRPPSTLDEASFMGASSFTNAMDHIEHKDDTHTSDPLPFLRQRRLPSILLDSWEFRKLAAEGSVLANAMVSYDVDDDGVEEVIVGTTEGLLCVVKPDCRAPLLLRVLAATISVVLYTPIQKRLVLVTLEGQCEVIDYFLSPNCQPQQQQQQQQGSTRPPSCGADSGDGTLDYQRTENATSISRGLSSSGGSCVNASASVWASQTASAGNPLGGPPSSMPRTRSHTSVINPLWYESANHPTPPPTHVFHVPSNCLCADLSTEPGTDLVFLGSYDRRFYVYCIATGSCLLSLFVHDPMTSIKAFAIPTTAAHVRQTTVSSSSISVGNRTGRHAGGSRRVDPTRAGGATRLMTRESSSYSDNASTHTVEYRSLEQPVNHYIPLVFLATPTHLLLLPAGVSEIQQWRKQQPKSAHLPLTVQLHGDPTTPPLGPASTSNRGVNTGAGAVSSSSEVGLQYKLSRSSGGGGAPFCPSASTSTASQGNGHTTSAGGGSDGFRGGGRSVTVPVTLTSSAGAPYGDVSAVPTTRRPLCGAAVAPPREGETPVPSVSRSGNITSITTTTASASAFTATTTSVGERGGGGGVDEAAHADSGVPLSGSQQRRQARKRAIQAAEMGRPVLVKPLWALRIGKYTLDVPELHPSPIPDNSELGRSTAAPTTSAASAKMVEPVSASATKRPAVSNASLHSAQDHRGSLSIASEHPPNLPQHSRRGSRQRSAIPRADSASFFSLSSPSSASGLRESSDLPTSSVTQSAAALDGGRSLRNSREGWEETEVSAIAATATTAAAAAVAAAASSGVAGVEFRGCGRSGAVPASSRSSRRPPRPQVMKGSSAHASNSSTAGFRSDVGSSDSNEDSRRSDVGGEKAAVTRLRRGRHGQIRSASGTEESSEGVRFSLPMADTGLGREDGGLGRALRAGEREGGEGERDLHQRGSGDSKTDASASDVDNCASEDASSQSSSNSSSDSDSDGGDAYDDDSDASRSFSGDSSADDGRRRSRSRHHRRSDRTAVDPALLAKSLARMRAESVPTMLLRRRVADPSTTSTTSIMASAGGMVNTQAQCYQDSSRGVGGRSRSGVHTSLVDLAHLAERHVHRGHHRHRRRDHSGTALLRQPPQRATKYTSDHQAHGEATTENAGSEGGDVRLPISVDISVGASQVAVAVSCEDGLAMELRFTVDKLSALSRRERNRAGRSVRLYDLRRSSNIRRTARRQAIRDNERKHSCGTARTLGGAEEAEAEWGCHGSASPPQQAKTRQPASSPSSPMRTRSFSTINDSGFRCGSSNSPRRRRRHGKSGRRPTSIIYLPPPTPGQTTTTAGMMNASSASPLQPSLVSASRGQAGDGKSAAASAGGAAAETVIDNVVGGTSSKSSMLNTQDPSSTSMTVSGDSAPERSEAQQQRQRQKLSNTQSSPLPTSPLVSADDAARSRVCDDEGLVLRAQCLWAARLGDSPLVQRTRVFCVKDNHQDNTFCAVFVAANGTCFAVDGDTLSVVECSVKEDCSSFTLMAGPSSTMPLPPPVDVVAGTFTPLSSSSSSPLPSAQGRCSNGSAPRAAMRRDKADGNDAEGEGEEAEEEAAMAGVVERNGKSSRGHTRTTALGGNANLLRGAVGRTVSCVCVSVDELCIYSVGDANQLVQHRDAPHVAPMPADLAEPAFLSSRQVPGRPCSTYMCQCSSCRPAALDEELEPYVTPSCAARRRGDVMDGVDDDNAVDDANTAEYEERALLQLLAQRLKSHAKQRQVSSDFLCDNKDKDDDDDCEDATDDATLLRVRQLLLRGYSDAEWEKLKWLDLGAT